MFVEQITKTSRVRLGSIVRWQDRRRLSNGLDAGFVSPLDNFANDSGIPQAPVDTGLLGSSRINTPLGPIALSEITSGQEISTQDGTVAVVRHVLKAEKPKTALRIRAPYFGANQDLIIGAEQYLEITSEIAEYMFGTQTICVPAWAFKDNSKVLHHELTRDDQMFQLQLDTTDAYGLGDCHVAPLVSPTSQHDKRFLDASEARAFATERRIGQYW